MSLQADNTAIILKLMEPWRKNVMYVFVCMGAGASDSPKQFRIRKRKCSSSLASKRNTLYLHT